MTKENQRNHLPVNDPLVPPAVELPSPPEGNFLPVISFFLVFVTACAFWQVGRCGFINYDDNQYVTGNIHVRQGITKTGLVWAFTSGHASNWHPLTWISHMVDVQVFGLRPAWHHIMNLLLHLANTVLLFLVLHRMTKALWQSVFVAALFALHPLHVESVVWVAERKDILSTFFWLLTMGAYALYVERPVLKRYFAVCGFFALGLMAKPMLVTLPFALLLLDYWPLGRLALDQPEDREKGGRKGKGRQIHPAVLLWTKVRPLIVEKTPLFTLAALSCVVTFFVQRHGGAMVGGEILPFSARLANALVSYAAYIGKMFWPTKLAVLYPHPGWWPFWKIALAAVVLPLLTALAMRVGRKCPYVPVGWFWYVGTLVPVIGIVQVGSQAMADRYTYVPLIGLFVVAAWGVPELLARLPRRRETLAVFAALCLLCLSCQTWRQVSYWRNDITLYTHTLAVTERNGMIYTNRGVAHWMMGNFSAAIADINKAIEINPGAALAYLNLGVAYRSLRDYARSIEAFNKAIEYDPKQALAYLNRGVAYYKGLTDSRRAIVDFTKAIEIEPERTENHTSRGAAYVALGEYTRALADFTKAVEISPGFAAAYHSRGATRGLLEDYPGAIADFTAAIRINPGFAAAYHSRGTAYWAMGKQAEAVDDFTRAIQMNPYFALAYHDRGAAYHAMGDRARATADLARAAELDPRYAVGRASGGGRGRHAGG
ncbi:MAG: tetratricopeptide repeat protein [Syntrophorhabdus aromaticivorans]|uniref:Tetratricopeptide repeat protein n=1 Tax=Syntrophorhabdus aromaticivorans TaxID=328301 RepID=A0A971M790_9BACT|nr:tetratricopeptide repeat protein [Syntrophorhabdus aromaticivorans]